MCKHGETAQPNVKAIVIVIILPGGMKMQTLMNGIQTFPNVASLRMMTTVVPKVLVVKKGRMKTQFLGTGMCLHVHKDDIFTMRLPIFHELKIGEQTELHFVNFATCEKMIDPFPDFSCVLYFIIYLMYLIATTY